MSEQEQAPAARTEGQELARVVQQSGTIQAALSHDKVRRLLEAKLRKVSVNDFTASAIDAATNPDLARCRKDSLILAIVKIAEMGLIPGNTHKHVYLIPRQDKVDVMPSWRGYMYLMRQIPGVASIELFLVHADDKIAWDPTCSTRLVWSQGGDPLTRGFNPIKNGSLDGTNLRGGFARFTMTDGVVRDVLVTGEHIRKAWSCAQSKNVWTAWPEAMYRKTVANAVYSGLASWLNIADGPALRELAKAAEADNEGYDLGMATQAPPALAPPQKGGAALAAKIQAVKAQRDAADALLVADDEEGEAWDGINVQTGEVEEGEDEG